MWVVQRTPHTPKDAMKKAKESAARTSQKEGDRICALVLELVQNLARDRMGSLAVVRSLPEPTGTGYLDPDVRDLVMKRSA